MKMKINVVGEYELERFFEELKKLEEFKKLDEYGNETYDDVMIGYAMGSAYIDFTDAKVAMIKYILANRNLFVKEDENYTEEEENQC